MAVNVEAVMRECKNYFERGYKDGVFTWRSGTLENTPKAPFIFVSGSAADGVYRLSPSGKPEVKETPFDESFPGRVWKLYPPDSFLSLCEEISSFEAKNPAGAMQSESFGAYSYSRGSGAHGALTWQEAFASRLNPFRRMFTEVC